MKIPTKYYYLLKGFIFFLILLVPVRFVIWAYDSAVEDSSIFSQKLAIRELRKHVDAYGKIPDNLSELSSEYSDFFGGIFYYPDAWSMPGRILLCSKRLITGSNVVTFGDGVISVVSRLDYSELQENKDNLNLIYPDTTSPLPRYYELLLYLLSIIIFVYLHIKQPKPKSGL